MATQDNKKKAIDALKRARADIASLTDWLECELQKQADENVTWATVGSIEHVRTTLVETLAFFSGFRVSEIQRSLDELRSEA
jgi:hypothetical protein